MCAPRLTSLRLLALAPLAGCSSESSFVGKDEEARDPVTVEESFVQEAEARVDVLWVIDDTSSMADEHAVLSDALGVFASALGELGLSWQMGVVTTDVSGESAGVLRGDPWILTPGVEGLEEALLGAADVGTEGASPEAGLGAAFLALSEPLRSGENRSFRREDAALHIVVVSDADDESEGVLGEDPGGAMTVFLEEEALRTGMDARLSAVVGDAPEGCTWDGGAAEPGETYLSVAEATGGVQASVCAADLSVVASALSDSSATWPTSFPLQETPDPDSVKVWVDDARVTEGFTVVTAPSQIVFDTPPAPSSEIRVRYEVAE